MSSSRFSMPLVVVSLVGGLAFGAVWVFLGSKTEPGQSVSDIASGLPGRDANQGQGQNSLGVNSSAAQNGLRNDPVAQNSSAGGGAEAASILGGADLEAEKSLGRDLARHVKSFFDAPEKTSDGRFVLKPQPVVWSENCNKTPERKTFTDLRDYIATTYTLPDELLPKPQSKTRVLHVNQFYSDPQAKKYYQLSLVQGGDPALGTDYRIERYSSLDVYMNDVEGNEVLAPATKRFDLSYEAAIKAFQDFVAQVEAQGMKMGTRGLVYGKAVPAGEFSETSIEMTGGRISGFNTKGISCDGITEQTLCECPSEENPGGEGFE